MNTKSKVRGFTLIEMLVTVAIVGILAAIAYPSYSEHVQKGRRAEAKIALQEGVQSLERYYSANGTYLNTAGDALAAVFPTTVNTSGGTSYSIAVQGAPTRNQFMLRATRAGSMVGDGCGDYQINNVGSRTLNDMATDRTLAACW